MANFGGYPQNVTYQTVNVSAGGGSENLLINPRGKINQANEAGGVLSAGQYFCDGWKAGAAGAEVYVDPDGFRLISGSIVQLVPNNLEAGRTIRGNMDVVIGTPSISINGGTDNELSDIAEYIQFEVSGDNSKFTRLILAESNSLPIYQQSNDELSPCQRFYYQEKASGNSETTWIIPISLHSSSNYWVALDLPFEMHKTPAASADKSTGSLSVIATRKRININDSGPIGITKVIADARP